MSFCEHMLGATDSLQSTTTPGPSTQEKLLNIQNELTWGFAYRNYKENEKRQPINPMPSPINIPFELCRAEMLMGSKKKLKIESEARLADQSSVAAGDVKKSSTKKKTSKIRFQRGQEKPSLLDRNVWSQNKYMDYLSIPNPKFYEDSKPKKYKKRCELEPCPPRFIQLAVPNKRRVFANWKEYANTLPTEMLMRYEEILHTDQNLDPREARYYYKKLDKKKRKERKKKRLLAKRRKAEKEMDTSWLKAQIDLLAKDIVDYIKDEPLLALNYKQMLLSDGILDRLDQTKLMKKPSRKTKNHYKKTVIEVSDKFAVWIDTLTRFVDVQAVESDEDIPPVSVPSLIGEGEGEGESETESDYESTITEGEEDFLRPGEEYWGEDGGEIFDSDVKGIAEGFIKDLLGPGEGGEGMGDLDDMLNNLDGDVLDKLIKILSNCSDEFLDGQIDDDQMPGLKYRDILDKLKALRDSMLTAEGDKSFLEQKMIEWALQNDPDNVNDEVLQKIHEVATFLGDFLMTPKPGREEGGEATGGEGGEATGEGDEATTEGDGEPEPEGPEGDVQEPADADAGGAEDADESMITVEVSAEEETIGEDGEAIGEAGSPEDEESPSPGAEDSEGKEGLDHKEGSTETALDTFGGMGMPEEATPIGGFDLEGEEAIGGIPGLEGEEDIEALMEGEEGISVIKPPIEPRIAVPPGAEGEEPSRLDGRIIKGHKPSKVFEHSPDTVCCLSLKTWAVWLLEVTHNAHNWTQWMSCVIQQIKAYASIVRGDVKTPDGKVRVLRKAEWRQFIAETEESIVAWRQYSSHVKDLSQSIVDNFHGKSVNCCPKCLQDHLITNVVVAHQTLQALTEAISCAAYWQRCLDNLVEKTCSLADTTKKETDKESSSEESEGDASLEEMEGSGESGDSVYEIEGFEEQSRPNTASK